MKPQGRPLPSGGSSPQSRAVRRRRFVLEREGQRTHDVLELGRALPAREQQEMFPAPGGRDHPGQQLTLAATRNATCRRARDGTSRECRSRQAACRRDQWAASRRLPYGEKPKATMPDTLSYAGGEDSVDASDARCASRDEPPAVSAMRSTDAPSARDDVSRRPACCPPDTPPQPTSAGSFLYGLRETTTGALRSNRAQESADPEGWNGGFAAGSEPRMAMTSARHLLSCNQPSFQARASLNLRGECYAARRACNELSRSRS